MKDCAHRNIRPSYDYVVCEDCGSIKTDSDRSWGIAKNKWFESLDFAEFYRKTGTLPSLAG